MPKVHSAIFVSAIVLISSSALLLGTACSQAGDGIIPGLAKVLCPWLGISDSNELNTVLEVDDSIFSPAARGGNLAKIPPNQVIGDFGRGSSVESESE